MNPSFKKKMISIEKKIDIKNRLKEIVDKCKMNFKDRKHLEAHLGKQLIIEGTFAYRSKTILGKNEETICINNVTCFYEDEIFLIDHFLTTNRDVFLLSEGTKLRAYAKAFKYNDKDKYGLKIEDIISITEVNS